MPTPPPFFRQIHPGWTLFLDRDGVLNKRLPGAYVRTKEEFSFLPGVLKALAYMARKFGRIFIVTNQQGVGKNLMTRQELDVLHSWMLEEIQQTGGRIDQIYACTEHARQPGNCRKPNPDMGHWAQRDFPEVDFNYALMVGDSFSDIQFGKGLGMKTVWVDTKEEDRGKLHSTSSLFDWRCQSLWELAESLGANP
jgi:D-glycero-D-manno-heptose 1,7-bisphosphate phosphatase